MTGRRVHRTMEVIPALPWKSKSPSVPIPIKQSRKQGDARGASEVRRGTSSIHFHCPVPRSSSHIGHGILAHKIHFHQEFTEKKGKAKNAFREINTGNKNGD